jgi:arsenate reductase (thioredoxin)
VAAPKAVHRSRVLFLCAHNSARSQRAESLLRQLAGDHFEVMSAGTEATHVRPLAIRAMEEIGVDISDQDSKTLNRYLQGLFDYIVTVKHHGYGREHTEDLTAMLQASLNYSTR